MEVSSLLTKEINEPKEYTTILLREKILRIFFDPFRSQGRPYDLLSLEQIADLGDRIMMTLQKSSQKFFEETKDIPRPLGTFRIGKEYCNPVSIGILLKTSDKKLSFVRFYLHPNGDYIDKENNIISEIEAAKDKLKELGIDGETNLKTIGIVFDKIKQPCVILTAEYNFTSSEISSKESLGNFMEPRTSPFYLGAMEIYKKL